MQASGWCCMRSTFLQILLILSSPEGYRLQFSIPRAYFVYTVWHCTGQHAVLRTRIRVVYLQVRGPPLASVITTLL